MLPKGRQGSAEAEVGPCVTPAWGAVAPSLSHPNPPPWNLVLESEGNEEGSACLREEEVSLGRILPSGGPRLTSRALGAGLRCWAGPMAYVA